MSDPALVVFVPDSAVQAALLRWGVGYTDFVVDKLTKCLHTESKRALSIDAAILVNDAKVVKVIWSKIVGGDKKPVRPHEAEKFVLEIDRLAQELGIVSRPGYTPLKCPECSHTGEPTLAWTVLADGVDRIAAWCRGCRKMIGLANDLDKAVEFAPPWQWLRYDQLLPEDLTNWPERKDRTDSNLDFPFGANESAA